MTDEDGKAVTGVKDRSCDKGKTCDKNVTYTVIYNGDKLKVNLCKREVKKATGDKRKPFWVMLLFLRNNDMFHNKF